MSQTPSRENREELRELLQQYNNLKTGAAHRFIDEESFETIISYYDDKDDLQNAVEAAGFAVEQHPYSAQLLLRRADLLIACRKYREAMHALEKAGLLDSNDINLYILKTDVYLALDQQAKAVALLESALNRFEGEERIELLFELADVYDDYEEFEKVFECLKWVLEQDPQNEEALYKICFWTDFTGRNEESIRLHQKIIDDYPYSELAWFNLASAFQGLKLYEKAIDAYMYAVVIDEKFDYAYRNMGDAYIRLRRYRDAIEMLEKVLELSRPEEVIYEAIGHCYDRMKNFAQARFYYRKASHLNPDNGRMYYKTACTYMNEEQWRSALKQLEVSLRISRNNPEYNQAAAECYMELDDFQNAVHHFSIAIHARPKSPRIWEGFIRCLYAAQLYDDALVQIELAVETTGPKPAYCYYKAAILFAMGARKEGLLQLENAMEMNPRQVKEFVALNPGILQNQQVVDVIARYKKSRKK